MEQPPEPENPVKSKSLYHRVKRWITIIIGVTVLGLGIAMIVLPGPAIIVIPVGLAILGGELLWARKYLAFIKKKLGLEEKVTDIDKK